MTYMRRLKRQYEVTSTDCKYRGFTLQFNRLILKKRGITAYIGRSLYGKNNYISAWMYIALRISLCALEPVFGQDNKFFYETKLRRSLPISSNTLMIYKVVLQTTNAHLSPAMKRVVWVSAYTIILKVAVLTVKF